MRLIHIPEIITKSMTVRAMVAFRHYMFRDCIVQSVLRTELNLNINIISECDNLHDLETQFRAIKPELLIVSVEILPRKNNQTIRVLEGIIRENRDSKIIGVTTFYDNEVEKDLMEIGAKGYFFQTSDLIDITEQLEGVIGGLNMLAKPSKKKP